MSHGQLSGGLSWGHILVDVELDQVKEELAHHTKLLLVTKTAIQDGLKDAAMTSAMQTHLKYIEREGETQAENIA